MVERLELGERSGGAAGSRLELVECTNEETSVWLLVLKHTSPSYP
jgi:hypothetical protein